MILEIRLSNFFSIKDEVILDLRAANIKSKNAKKLSDNLFQAKEQNILKTLVIYGANASGKSNIIKAIRFCSRMILNSHNHNENAVFNYKKFKFDNWNKKPSKYFIRFICSGIEYAYSFSLFQAKIVTEELYYYPKGRKAKVFLRDESLGKNKKEKYSFGNVIKRPLDVAENTSEKTLYLSRASQMDREIAKELFSYFDTKILLDTLLFNVSQTKHLFEKYEKLVLEALKIADSDIIDIELKDLTKTFEVPTFDDLQITTYHKRNPAIGFNFNTEESQGTRKLFLTILTILDVVVNNKILLMDEIESSLHSDIVEYLFNLFRASKSAQLICTTHNTRFLDLRKFRKDQIYFVNKKEDASTDFYSLYDYSDFRDTMDLEKAYLQGRFDSIPIINDSLENLRKITNG